MRCPICKAKTRYAGNPYRPFCSERCKLIDLAKWLEGCYKVPGNYDAARQTENPRNEESDNAPG
jgi:endogenous inhibitor of DNA gyrase (YacG/DUF329 family)